MKLLHGANHVGNVLDHVNRTQLGEGAVAKWVRKTVQVAQHIGAGVRVAIHADGAGVFVDSAADVENALGGGAYTAFLGGSYAVSFKQSSSVSTAKSA
jgi:hypothetical protein